MIDEGARFQGIVYRAHHPAWVHDPESGEGARVYGGRFNRPGRACLYTALSVGTAWLEAQQGFAFKAQPMTICAYDVDCGDIIDLTDPTTRSALAVTLADLGCAWERLADRKMDVPSWKVADRLIGHGCAGAVMPSFAARAAEDDRNLVLWKWSRDLPHRITVLDDFGRLSTSHTDKG